MVAQTDSACRQLWVRKRRGEYELNPEVRAPFTEAQLAAAAVMAPGIGVYELMTLRYTLASPLAEDAAA